MWSRPDRQGRFPRCPQQKQPDRSSTVVRWRVRGRTVRRGRNPQGAAGLVMCPLRGWMSSFDLIRTHPSRRAICWRGRLRWWVIRGRLIRRQLTGRLGPGWICILRPSGVAPPARTRPLMASDRRRRSVRAAVISRAPLIRVARARCRALRGRLGRVGLSRPTGKAAVRLCRHCNRNSRLRSGCWEAWIKKPYTTCLPKRTRSWGPFRSRHGFAM